MNSARQCDLVGRRVPGGEFSFADYEAWIAHDALYSIPRSESHPMMAYFGLHQGMGFTIAQLFELFDADISDGPVLADCTICIEQDLTVDTVYSVEGQIVSVTRKSGVAFGEFDLIQGLFTIKDPSGTVMASITNHYAVRRPDA